MLRAKVVLQARAMPRASRARVRRSRRARVRRSRRGRAGTPKRAREQTNQAMAPETRSGLRPVGPGSLAFGVGRSSSCVGRLALGVPPGNVTHDEAVEILLGLIELGSSAPGLADLAREVRSGEVDGALWPSLAGLPAKDAEATIAAALIEIDPDFELRCELLRTFGEGPPRTVEELALIVNQSHGFPVSDEEMLEQPFQRKSLLWEIATEVPGNLVRTTLPAPGSVVPLAELEEVQVIFHEPIDVGTFSLQDDIVATIERDGVVEVEPDPVDPAGPAFVAPRDPLLTRFSEPVGVVTVSLTPLSGAGDEQPSTFRAFRGLPDELLGEDGQQCKCYAGIRR